MKTHIPHSAGRIYRTVATAIVVGLSGFQAGAQLVFSAADVQSHIGQFRQAYVSTNIDASRWSLQGGGPQAWDFSQPPNTNESVERWDIVAVNDAQNTSQLTNSSYWTSFTNAMFSERVSSTVTPGNIGWTFESVDAQNGFVSYGLFNQAQIASGPLFSFSVYEPPVQLLPYSVQVGTSWSLVSVFTNLLVGIGPLPESVQLTISNYADAFGTVTLPQIGSVPALRFINYYEAQTGFAGGVIATVWETNYIWLVRGIGPAVELSFYAGAPNLTNTLMRVFDSSAVAGSAAQIVLKNGRLMLDWTPASGAAGYTVESVGSLGATNHWQVAAAVSSNSWSIPLPTGQTQQFFRILLDP